MLFSALLLFEGLLMSFATGMLRERRRSPPHFNPPARKQNYRNPRLKLKPDRLEGVGL